MNHFFVRVNYCMKFYFLYTLCVHAIHTHRAQFTHGIYPDIEGVTCFQTSLNSLNVVCSKEN